MKIAYFFCLPGNIEFKTTLGDVYIDYIIPTKENDDHILF